MPPAKNSANPKGFQKAKTQHEAPEEVLIFERYEILPKLQAIRYCCTLRRDKVSEEYALGIKFHEALPASWESRDSAAHGIILGLGLACISHVWTGFCTPTIIVRAGYLSPAEVEFWRDTFTLGLCEHLLINQITSLRANGASTLQVDIVVEAPAPSAAVPAQESAPTAEDGAACPTRRRVLMPLGGGKDSTTVLEMLKLAQTEAIVPFFMADPEGEFKGCWRYKALCQVGGVEPVCVADFWWPDNNYRSFRASRKRLASGKEWDDSARLWACLVGFASALAAMLRDCDYVAVGNERSANHGNGV